MDKDRQIRFLYPPLIFLASIGLGIFFDETTALRCTINEFLIKEHNSNILIAILGAGSIILVLGFLLGTITVFILRLIFIRNGWIYELKLSEKSYHEIGKLILKSQTDSIKKKDRLYAGVIFDHGFIHKDVHHWSVRRWNAFFISTASILALITSLIIGSLLEIALTLKWLAITIPLIAIFIVQSIFSWKETMGMIAFMIRVKKDDGTKEIEQSSGTKIEK